LRPLRDHADARDHSEVCAQPNHHIAVVPIVLALLPFYVGPGEEFDYRGRAHFTHHLKGALNFPFFDFVGQASMHAGNWVLGLDGLGFPNHHITQAVGGRLENGGDEDETEEPAQQGKVV
jgi:hypothetical protein